MDLKLDLERLKKLDSDLKAIVSEFNGADDFSDTVAAATGHDDLHDAVHDFAHAWNEKRPQMTDGVKKLEQKLSAITEGFTKIDTQLAQAMEQVRADEAKGQNPPASPANHGPRRAE
jgi:uncharacterized phage infection (PIP) family protein YhgE